MVLCFLCFFSFFCCGGFPCDVFRQSKGNRAFSSTQHRMKELVLTSCHICEERTRTESVLAWDWVKTHTKTKKYMRKKHYRSFQVFSWYSLLEILKRTCPKCWQLSAKNIFQPCPYQACPDRSMTHITTSAHGRLNKKQSIDLFPNEIWLVIRGLMERKYQGESTRAANSLQLIPSNQSEMTDRQTELLRLIKTWRFLWLFLNVTRP